VNCICHQQEQICAEEASTYAKFQQASEELKWLHKKMQFFSAKLLCLWKQQHLLKEWGYAILNWESKNAESLEEKDCQLLKSLISKISEEDHQFKRLYYNLSFNPSSSNA